MNVARLSRLCRMTFSVAVATILLGCGAGTDEPTLSPKASLGKTMFFDTALSASGKQSCASCHAPEAGFAAPDAAAVSLGGPLGNLPGLRNSPGLTYLSFTPAFAEQPGIEPRGGFFADGRSPSLAHQAQQPFLSSFEMANANAAEVLQRLKSRPYLDQFEAVFGSTSSMAADVALKNIGEAIAAFETDDVSFRPFSSKFDLAVRKEVTLTAAEANGMAIFNDPTKGNCSACHSSTPAATDVPALFTNFAYQNLGAPRNWGLAANNNATTLSYVPANGAAYGAQSYRYYDLGVCGPLNTNVLTSSTCGKFKVPSLRNVEKTAPYFHNGVFTSLTDTVTWYATRTLDAQRWYRKADGVTPDAVFNDLPASLRGNVNIEMAPYIPGPTAKLTPAEIADVVSFLCTLTDGYDPANPAAYHTRAECKR